MKNLREEAIRLAAEHNRYRLPDGTEVVITWPGGNGPHHYRIHTHGKTPYAVPVDVRNEDRFDESDEGPRIESPLFDRDDR